MIVDKKFEKPLLYIDKIYPIHEVQKILKILYLNLKIFLNKIKKIDYS
jgi:hypothetical protein